MVTYFQNTLDLIQVKLLIGSDTGFHVNPKFAIRRIGEERAKLLPYVARTNTTGIADMNARNIDNLYWGVKTATAREINQIRHSFWTAFFKELLTK